MSKKLFSFTEYQPKSSSVWQKMDVNLCQSDYPLDWYPPEFIPYAEEYQALPDRKFSTIVSWMEKYINPAKTYFGDELLLLAHYYMGGEIVKLIEYFGGFIGDSYELALQSLRRPEKKIIIESAVHFMAESIAILAAPDQKVFITNPKAGCTMESLAKDFMVEPAFRDLNERYGEKNILPVCYMNTSGRIKALCGAQGGSVCTSSNVEKIFRWALKSNKKILFIPDKNMGENVARWVGIEPNQTAYWPGGTEGAHYHLMDQPTIVLKQFDNAKLVLFKSLCGVHDYYRPEMVSYWQDRGYHVIAHPECPPHTVAVANSYGSTAYIWETVVRDRFHTKKYAIATENHMVENLKFHGRSLGIAVVNVGDAPLEGFAGRGCGCATMSRNDPPHLVGLLDLLRKGERLLYHEVEAGDMVNEFTGIRKRLDKKGQRWVAENAKKALNKMVEIVEDTSSS